MTPAETEVELERHHAAGFAWAMACCGRRRERAEDVLQTSYLKILDGRARFEGRSSFRTFLFGVIRRTASEERRRDALTSFLFRDGTGTDEIAAGSGSVSVEQLAFRNALAKLARRQREVLELVFSMGMTVQEAAETLSISAGSARVHYDRGKKRLSTLLGKGNRA
ncbi:MAG TPA: sigma-70 family RNA polymerase sigma factor [Thermoanaerobaculia bacterium]